VSLFEVDARTRRGAFSARAEFAMLFLGNTAALNEALLGGTPEQVTAGPVASQSRGGYVEVAYDVLPLFRPTSSQSVTAFGRFDYADTQAVLAAGLTPRLEFRRYSEVLGLVYRPIPQVALKADYRFRQFGAGPASQEFATAITWLF
jgi:hypothetical protein